MNADREHIVADDGGGGGVSITAADIAARVGGELLGGSSQGGTEEDGITGIAPLDRAGERDVSFLGSSRYSSEYESSRAGVVLIRSEFKGIATSARKRIVVAEPLEAILALLPFLHPEQGSSEGIHPSATIGRGALLSDAVSLGPCSVIGKNASIGEGSLIGAHCVVGDGVVIGSNCVLHPSVTLYSGAILGDRVIVHSGARIGSDGFGYLSRAGGHGKIRHVGRCVLQNDVEVGANSTIDRGSIDDTIVGSGTKIDNLVHVAHNVRIGKNCLILAQVGIAGSARIEDGVVLAGQSGVAGHITVARGARLGAQSGVIGDVPAGATWSGYPARPHGESMRSYATLRKLTGMMKRLESLLDETR